MVKCISLIIKSWTVDDRIAKGMSKGVAAKLSKYRIVATNKATEVLQSGFSELTSDSTSLIDKVISDCKEIRSIAPNGLHEGVVYTTEKNNVVKYSRSNWVNNEVNRSIVSSISKDQSAVNLHLVIFKGKEYIFVQTSDLSQRGIECLPRSPFSYEMPMLAHNSPIVSWKDSLLYMSTGQNSSFSIQVASSERTLVSLDKDKFTSLAQCRTFLVARDSLFFTSERQLHKYGGNQSSKMDIEPSTISHGPNKSLVVSGKILEPKSKTKKFILFNRFLRVIDSLAHSTDDQEFSTVEVLKKGFVSFVVGITHDCHFTMAAVLRKRLFIVEERERIYQQNQYPPTLMRSVILPGESAILAVCNGTNFGMHSTVNQWSPGVFLLYPRIN